MVSKRIHYLKNIGKLLLIFLTVVAALALLLAYLAKITHPTLSTLVAYCGLLFPYLFLANVVFVVVWLFLDYRWTLVPVAFLLLNVNNVDKHFQLRAQDKPETCANCIKVMSYNAHGFNVYDDNRSESRKKIFRFLTQENPDILCVQEYCTSTSKKHHFDNTAAILNTLDLMESERSHRLYLPMSSRTGYQYGLAIFSKYRIVGSGVVETGDSTSNKSMYVDIRFNGDTLRIYNIHLSSMHMDNDDYLTGMAMMNSDVSDTAFNNKAKKLMGKVATAFKMRQKQAINVRAHIDTCRFPTIICGDFNDSPGSFSVHKIGHGFKDSFRSSGKGTGATYFSDAFPPYRIDFIFHDRQYNDFGHTVCTNLKTSDHCPIYTYISIINKD